MRKFCEHVRTCVSYDRYASWAPTSLAQRALAPERGGAWIALPPELSPFSRFAKTRYLASPGGDHRAPIASFGLSGSPGRQYGRQVASNLVH